ncbi:E3 ubiquitin-protein ligase RING1-like [Oryza brachyantha]|uniref:E3 ubiquitin-protein ligase RING1-like n=1 Tax=Oryza brachyantha TaxID=4533 RepID=UPI001ADA21E4|nr:E3 ubiquitin-protein ligase RING1-like [Oryza brachyantha]
MLYPERPGRVNGTATVDCAAYPLDCLPLCPTGNCSEIAEPQPPPFSPRTRAEVASDDHHLPVRLLLTVSLLSAFLFLSLAVSTVLLYRRRVILRRRRRAAAAPLPGDDGFGDGDEEAGGGGGDVHHVWYIRTVGLDEATITSIATAEYRAGVGWGGDCAVCLGEFRDGELVRLLPRCAHPFHAPCIDTWLRAHVNCPLCRSPVVVPSDLPATATEADAEGGQVEEHQVFDEISLSESHDEVSEDSDASSDTQSEDTAAAAEDNGRMMPKPIRRSASMDSPLFLVVVPDAQDDAVRANRKLPNGQEMKVFSVKGKEATGTSSSSCQAGRFGICRSMSSSGQGFFFSRNGRSRSTVLPL